MTASMMIVVVLSLPLASYGQAMEARSKHCVAPCKTMRLFGKDVYFQRTPKKLLQQVRTTLKEGSMAIFS